MKIALLAAVLLSLIATEVLAQSPPGQVVTGAGSVMIDGKPAARQGDATTSGTIVSGSSNVFINGRPAVTVGDGTDCGGSAVSGSRGVFINGKPMVRQGDTTSGCAGK